MILKTFCWDKNHSQAQRTVLLLKEKNAFKSPVGASAYLNKGSSGAARAPCVAKAGVFLSSELYAVLISLSVTKGTHQD